MRNNKEKKKKIETTIEREIEKTKIANKQNKKPA